MINTYDHENYQADSSAYGFEVVRQVASPVAKALHDIYHMVRVNEDPLKDIVGNLGPVGHLHAQPKCPPGHCCPN